jgi:hypothetical protein
MPIDVREMLVGSRQIKLIRATLAALVIGVRRSLIGARRIAHRPGINRLLNES